MSTISEQIKVADEVWVATALLHREHPERCDFKLEEIVERAAQEAGHEPLRPGVYVHVVQHCVANRPPNPGRYRMLFETAPGRRRLFRKGDIYHPAREGSKVTPDPNDLPRAYGELLRWYDDWSTSTALNLIAEDPLLSLRKLSQGLWANEDPDEYVRRLREGWE